MVKKIATCLFLGISLSIGIVPAAETQTQDATGISIRLNRIPIGDISGFLCPAGHKLSPWTAPYCLPPVSGTCTTYFCIPIPYHVQPGQPAPTKSTPQRVLATTNPPGKATTVCTQSRDPCSLDVPAGGRTFTPTLQQLVDAVPDMFPGGLEKVQMVRPDK